MSNKKCYIEDLEDRVKDDVTDRFKELNESQYPEDLLNELIDGWCPIYNGDILEYASNCPDLATDEPEILAFDGKQTPINTIVGNIYERLFGVAFEKWEELKEKTKECDECFELLDGEGEFYNNDTDNQYLCSKCMEKLNKVAE